MGLEVCRFLRLFVSLDAVIICPSRGCPLGARYSGLLVPLVIPLSISKSSLISACFSLDAVMTLLGGGPLGAGGSLLCAVLFLAFCGDSFAFCGD